MHIFKSRIVEFLFYYYLLQRLTQKVQNIICTRQNATRPLGRTVSKRTPVSTAQQRATFSFVYPPPPVTCKKTDILSVVPDTWQIWMESRINYQEQTLTNNGKLNFFTNFTHSECPVREKTTQVNIFIKTMVTTYRSEKYWQQQQIPIVLRESYADLKIMLD